MFWDTIFNVEFAKIGNLSTFVFSNKRTTVLLLLKIEKNRTCDLSAKDSLITSILYQALLKGLINSDEALWAGEAVFERSWLGRKRSAGAGYSRARTLLRWGKTTALFGWLLWHDGDLYFVILLLLDRQLKQWQSAPLWSQTVCMIMMLFLLFVLIDGNIQPHNL